MLLWIRHWLLGFEQGRDSAYTLRKERASCSCTEYSWGGGMRLLRAVTD